jgi:SAM-dependent methyltransferase
VDEAHHRSAEAIRSQVSKGRASSALVRAAIAKVPAAERDAWLDAVLGLDGLPDDDPALPRGCVPYLPCSVDALLRVVDHADVGASDVLVDVGSGLGRAAALVHLLTGAAAIGLEVQPALARASRALATRLDLPHLTFVEGDAAALTGVFATGSVFFLYCPFSGARLRRVWDALEPLARRRPIRVCCVDLPLPEVPWLTLTSPPWGDLAIYRSTLDDPPHIPSSSENRTGTTTVLNTGTPAARAGSKDHRRTASSAASSSKG